MGLITTTVKIIPTKRNYNQYKKLGYDFNLGEEIEIKVSELSESSKIKVQCSCDYCGIIFKKAYADYINALKGVIPKTACSKCCYQKRKESNLIIYGVDNPARLEEIKNKIKNTCIEKFGSSSPFGNLEIQEKIKKTNLERYGVENVFSSEGIKDKIKESNIKIYGVPSPTQSPEIYEKIKNTMIQQYGASNAMYIPEFKEKAKETNKEKYGCEYASQSNQVKQKTRETNIKLYGTEYYSQTPEFKEKCNKTSLEKYGVEHPTQLEEIKNKTKQSMIAKYGYESPQQCPEIKEKTKETNLERYGGVSPANSEIVKEKIRQTNLIKYGYESSLQSPIIRQKGAITLYNNQCIPTSRQQKYIHNLFGGELNGVVSHYNCDIVFREEKIIFEYDGGGHFLGVKLGEETEEEFKRKELIRDKCIKNEGFRIVRIISRKDYLPSDTILLQMLQYARDFFTQNPDRSWLSFDLDNNCIYNAYHKETDTDNILFYDFGKLHKIDNIEVAESAESIETSKDTNNYVLEPISVNINNICSIY